MIEITYQDGYKYQLAKGYAVSVPIHPEKSIGNDFIQLDPDGRFTFHAGYAWDGPSGPTFDTPNFMRGSLIHDGLYQLMREGLLDHSFREKADEILRATCIEDGMSSIRAWWVFQGVNKFGNAAITKSKCVFTAP